MSRYLTENSISQESLILDEHQDFPNLESSVCGKTKKLFDFLR